VSATIFQLSFRYASFRLKNLQSGAKLSDTMEIQENLMFCLSVKLRMGQERYAKWCRHAKYNYNDKKAEAIYAESCDHVDTLPKNETTKLLIVQAINQLNAITETLATIQKEMLDLAAQLPEYPAVMRMFGVGETLGPQLMAEIGDVRRFERKQSSLLSPESMHHRISLVPLNPRVEAFQNEDLHGSEKRYFKSCRLFCSTSHRSSSSLTENVVKAKIITFI
jgi:hypothetical protein